MMQIKASIIPTEMVQGTYEPFLSCGDAVGIQ